MTTHTFDDPIRQELWSTLRALNDAWTKGDPNELVRFFHPNMIAITATDRHRREGAAACIQGWQAFAAATQIHHWREIDPLIQLYGDAAVVAYDFDISFTTQGQAVQMGGRDMFFFVRENGRWWAVADQFSAYP